ncbi:MAG: aminoglycoside 3'-phosphotransferase [Propionibacteriaceae bacterium]
MQIWRTEASHAVDGVELSSTSRGHRAGWQAVGIMSGFPTEPVAIPEPISRAANGRLVTPVWFNSDGGLTFQLGIGPGRQFAKWAPAGSPLKLGAEADRCRWASAYLPVPHVVDFGHNLEGAWLVTEGLPGENAVSPRWKARPQQAVVAVATGLRTLHDTLPVATCPFDWSVSTRLVEAQAAGLSVGDLRNPPATDQVVVCHGDACVPNTLIDDAGRCSGHVDLGSLGVADRWADLAVATMSLDWNYGPGWEDTFFEAYGIEADPERIDYYRELWNLGP